MASPNPPAAENYFNAAYRSTAIRISTISWVGYLPTVFLLYCVIVKPEIYTRYKASVVLTSGVMFAGSVLQTLFYTWFSLFVVENVPTTIFMCTFLRQCYYLVVVSYMIEPVIAFARYMAIVRGREIKTVLQLALLIVFAIPITTVITVGMFFPAQRSDVCSYVIGFNSYMNLVLISLIPTYFMAFVSIGFNFRTAIYIRAHLKQMNKWRKDELNVTHGLIARSFVPILLWTTKMSYHLIASSGVSIHITVLYIIDAIPPAAVGLTTLFSCLSSRVRRPSTVSQFRGHTSQFTGDQFIELPCTHHQYCTTIVDRSNSTLSHSISMDTQTPIFFLSSFQPSALKNAIISWAGTIPTVFLVLVIMINPRLWTRYKISVFIPCFIYFLSWFPRTMYMTWFSLYVTEDRLSTLFSCSFSRIVINYVSLIPQAVEPIIVLTRYRRIVLDRETPIWASALVAGFFGGTMFALGLSGFFLPASRNDNCNLVQSFVFHIGLYSISLALIFVYGFSTIMLSILTAIFLRKHARTIAKAKKNARDEMCVSVGIVARSAVPVFFWFIRALSVLLSGDWSLPRWFYTLFDTISYGSVACSTIASCAPIPVFRQMFFRALLLGRYRSPTVYPTAAAISQIEEERVQNQEGKARETKATATSAVSTIN